MDFPFYAIRTIKGNVVGYSQVSQVQPWTKWTEKIEKAKKYKNKGSAINRLNGLLSLYKWNRDGFRIELVRFNSPTEIEVC